MARGIKNKKPKKVENVATTLFITIILLLKQVGDLILTLVFKFLTVFQIAYKNIKTVGKRVKESKLTTIISFFNKKQKKGEKKEKIIFQSKPPWTRVKNEIFWRLRYLGWKLRIFPPFQLLITDKIKFFFIGAFVVLGIAILNESLQFIKSLPDPNALNRREIAASTKIYDRNGTLLYEIYAEQNRTPVTLADIPQVVKDATIATEDKAFYTHQGFSFTAIIRALLHNATLETQEGASTITQQLIRSAFLTPEKTITRKVKEIFLAIWAERIYTKDQILEMYLNQVPYGGTAWGIEAASQTYFGKSVKDLSLAQAALLAGLPAAPSLYSPFGSRPELAKSRLEEVLRRMVSNGYIKQEDVEKAASEDLNLKSQRVAILAPHFVMYVKDLLEKEYGARLVDTGGLRVITTLDLKVQEMAQKTVASRIENLKNLNVGNGAALVTDPKTGEILAMVGSIDFFDKEHDGNVNVTLALRQPGSSIKVINYAAALQHGFTAATILDDTPVTFAIPNQPPYKPVNYDGKYHGRLPLRVALASSYNIPAVKVLAKIGVTEMIEQGKRMGITTWEDKNRYGLSLTLGGGEVTMLDMAKVYGTLANKGMFNELTPFIKITNYKGEEIPLPPKKRSTRAVPASVAFILSSILSDNAARTPAFGPRSSLVIPGKTVAVKTGTSDNKRDNWTIGYTPDYVVSVWTGNNNNSPMHPLLTSGVTGAAPIWHDITSKLLQDKEDVPFIPPQDVIAKPCYGKTEYFIAGTEPKSGCPRLAPISPTP